MLVENRVSNRSPPVDMPATDFYKLTAQTNMSQVGAGSKAQRSRTGAQRSVRAPLQPSCGSSHAAARPSCCPSPLQWDSEAIRAARTDLLQQLADPGRRLIGPGQLQDVAEAVEQSGGWRCIQGKPKPAPIAGAVLLPGRCATRTNPEAFCHLLGSGPQCVRACPGRSSAARQSSARSGRPSCWRRCTCSRACWPPSASEAQALHCGGMPCLLGLAVPAGEPCQHAAKFNRASRHGTSPTWACTTHGPAKRDLPLSPRLHHAERRWGWPRA